MTGIGYLHWKTTVHLALEIDDFRPSYITKIMDRTVMCPGKGIVHIATFNLEELLSHHDQDGVQQIYCQITNNCRILLVH